MSVGDGIATQIYVCDLDGAETYQITNSDESILPIHTTMWANPIPI